MGIVEYGAAADKISWVAVSVKWGLGGAADRVYAIVHRFPGAGAFAAGENRGS
jgi:hypothetical protein